MGRARFQGAVAWWARFDAMPALPSLANAEQASEGFDEEGLQGEE